MALTSVEKNQEIMSLALEDRSSGYQDLVSNSNALLAVLKRKDNWKTYSGATIRERLLYAKSGNVVWYNGYDFMAECVFRDMRELEELCERLERNYGVKQREVHYVIEELSRERFLADPALLEKEAPSEKPSP